MRASLPVELGAPPKVIHRTVSAPPPGGHAELDLARAYLVFVHRRYRRSIPMCKTEADESKFTQDTSLVVQAYAILVGGHHLSLGESVS